MARPPGQTQADAQPAHCLVLYLKTYGSNRGKTLRQRPKHGTESANSNTDRQKYLALQQEQVADWNNSHDNFANEDSGDSAGGGGGNVV